MIRARVKKIEDLDPRFICHCRMRMGLNTGKEFQLEDKVFMFDLHCAVCGHHFGPTPCRRAIGESGWWMVPFFDLDEGEHELP